MAWQEYVKWGMYWAVYALVHLPQILLGLFVLWLTVKLLGLLFRALGILGGWGLATMHISKHLLRPVIWACDKTGLMAKHPWLKRVFLEIMWFGYSKSQREAIEREDEAKRDFQRQQDGDFDRQRYEQRRRERPQPEDEPQYQQEQRYSSEDFYRDFKEAFGEEEPVQNESSKSSEPTPWEILGISPGASKAEVKKAYHAKTKLYHPDRINDMGPELKELAEQKMKEINGAWNKLK